MRKKYSNVITSMDLLAMNIVKRHFGNDLVTIQILEGGYPPFNYEVTLLNHDPKRLRVYVDMGQEQVVLPQKARA